MLQLKKRNSFITFLYLVLISLILMSVGLKPIIVKAETNTESEIITPREIIENTEFLTYKKGEDAQNGKFMVACFYMPEEVYVAEYTYGVLICPKSYIDRFIVQGDYFNEFEEQGITIANIVATSNMQTPEGRMFRCGLVNISTENLDREFSFIFYATDADNAIAYSNPEYAIYNTLLAQDYSDAELVQMLGQKWSMNESFQIIVNNLSELIDTIWIYLVIACAAVIVVVGVYIGIRIIVANKKEEKIDASNMLKGLFIGVLVVFILAVAMPLLIKGLNAWLN